MHLKQAIYIGGIVKYPKILVFNNGNENGDANLKKYLNESIAAPLCIDNLIIPLGCAS